MQALVFAYIQVVRVATASVVDGLHEHLCFLSLHVCG